MVDLPPLPPLPLARLVDERLAAPPGGVDSCPAIALLAQFDLLALCTLPSHHGGEHADTRLTRASDPDRPLVAVWEDSEPAELLRAWVRARSARRLARRHRDAPDDLNDPQPS